MSVVHDELNATGDKGGKWFLRKAGSDVFGPEDLSVIARWVEESRVVSGNEISQDKKTWKAVEDFPDFKMDWIAELPDGRTYGPFNINATRDLHMHKVLPAEAVLVNRHTKDTATVEDCLASQSELKQEPGGSDETKKEAADTAAKTGDPADEESSTKEAKAAPGGRKRRSQKSTTKPIDEKKDGKENEDSTKDNVTEDTVATDAGKKKKSSSNISNEVETLTVRLAESEKTANDLRSSLVELENANARQLKDIQKAEKEARSASKKISTLEAQLAEKLTADNEAREKEKKALQHELKTCEKKIEELGALKEDLEKKAAYTEEKLTTALSELKKARKDGETALSNLKEVETRQARKQSVQQKHLSDLLEERNHLAQVVEVQSRRTSRLRFVVIALILLSIAGIVILLVRNGKDRNAELLAEGLAPEQAGLDTQDPVAEVENPLTGERRVPFPIIKAEGIEVFYNKTGCDIVFKDAVFSSGTTPSPEALAIIKRIAPQAKRYTSRYHLVVEGHTDNEPLGSRSKYRNNYELGMARSQVIANLLTKDHRIPGSTVKATSAGAENPPYPNDSNASRKKNRTVVLKLVRHVRI